MIYFPMHGVRRYVPGSRRVTRALKGLEAAVRTKRVFHLWFHPTNLADGLEPMFDGLEQVAAHASALREQGRLEILSMQQLLARCEHQSPQGIAK
jgi:hypothetical protein